MISILNTVKKLLNIPEDYTQFDTDLIIHINSVFMILTQMGVGPTYGFSIVDENAAWTDFIPATNPNFEAVKSYVPAKVRLMFDPPTSSIIMNSTKELISELEWRLNHAAEIL